MLNKTHPNLKIKYNSGYREKIKYAYIAPMNNPTFFSTVEKSLSNNYLLPNAVFIIDYIGDATAAWIELDQIIWFDNHVLNVLFGKKEVDKD